MAPGSTVHTYRDCVYTSPVHTSITGSSKVSEPPYTSITGSSNFYEDSRITNFPFYSNDCFHRFPHKPEAGFSHSVHLVN